MNRPQRDPPNSPCVLCGHVEPESTEQLEISGTDFGEMPQGSLTFAATNARPVYGTFVRWLFRRPKHFIVTSTFNFDPNSRTESP